MEATVSPNTSPVPASEGEGRRAAAPERSALMANAIRALAMDAVQQANSGHPGAPMGMAEIAVALWGRHLRHNPANPKWPGRDRFVLSNGHALDAAVFAAASHRLRPRALRAAQLPPAAQPDAGPSRARPDAGRRDDDRAARPGPGQRRRHGARRKAARRRVQPRPATTSSITAPTSSSATAA